MGSGMKKMFFLSMLLCAPLFMDGSGYQIQGPYTMLLLGASLIALSSLIRTDG